MKQKRPMVSVVIATLTINDYLTQHNLPALAAQRYKQFEVIVLPNERSDNDESLLAHYPWLRIIPTHNVTRPAAKRDIGVRHAKGEIIAFLDDDAFPSPRWLQRAVHFFQKKRVAAVCGPGILPTNAQRWERVFDALLTTWLGSGGLSYRFQAEKPRFVDDYATMNFLITKKAFERVGGFDSNYWPGEDSKLCEDLVHVHNEQIYYHPEVLVHHHRRNDLKGFLKQHGQYGYHRGGFIGHGDRNSFRWFYPVPTLFVLYLLAAIGFGVATFFYPLLLNPWLIGIVYAPLVVYLLWLFSLGTSIYKKTRSLHTTLMAPLVLFAMHLVYGVHFVRGLLKRNNLYGASTS